MATEPIKKRPAVYVQISSLRPDTSGHNLKLKASPESYIPMSMKSSKLWQTYNALATLYQFPFLLLSCEEGMPQYDRLHCSAHRSLSKVSWLTLQIA